MSGPVNVLFNGELLTDEDLTDEDFEQVSCSLDPPSYFGNILVEKNCPADLQKFNSFELISVYSKPDAFFALSDLGCRTVADDEVCLY